MYLFCGESQVFKGRLCFCIGMRRFLLLQLQAHREQHLADVGESDGLVVSVPHHAGPETDHLPRDHQRAPTASALELEAVGFEGGHDAQLARHETVVRRVERQGKLQQGQREKKKKNGVHGKKNVSNQFDIEWQACMQQDWGAL